MKPSRLVPQLNTVCSWYTKWQYGADTWRRDKDGLVYMFSILIFGNIILRPRKRYFWNPVKYWVIEMYTRKSLFYSRKRNKLIGSTISLFEAHTFGFKLINYNGNQVNLTWSYIMILSAVVYKCVAFVNSSRFLSLDFSRFASCT